MQILGIKMPYTKEELEKMTRPTSVQVMRTAIQMMTIALSSLRNMDGTKMDLNKIDQIERSSATEEFPNREALAQIPNVPLEILAVSEACKKAGVDISDVNLENVVKHTEILNHPIENKMSFFDRFVEKAKRETKLIKTEDKFADEFALSAQMDLEKLIEKGDNITPKDIEACRTSRTYNEAGNIAHRTRKIVQETLATHSLQKVLCDFSIGDEHYRPKR